MFYIKSTEAIKTALLAIKPVVRNFPRTLNFPFHKLYLEIVTQIKTIEISSECVLFDSVQSFNETKALADPDYWKAGEEAAIDKFWIFGQNGQGDLWLFDFENKVYFYDHNLAEMSQANFIDLEMNFEKWLQFADLHQQLDRLYHTANQISENQKSAYQAKLHEIASALLYHYPFDL